MSQRHRRVVTGHDELGRSIILMDGESPNSVYLEKAGGLQSTELWETVGSPADNTASKDAAERERRIEPAAGGTVFRIIEYPPDRVRLRTLDPKVNYANLEATHATDRTGRRHPGTHRTNTVDYAIILSGEIYAVMDVGEVLLHAGDCLIQRGTNHAWSNRTNDPCVIAFVLVSAAPLELGSR
jgi:mannose-6-phosphate isomerase-like protein (cupin superfamily)